MPGGPRSSKSKSQRLPTQIVRGCIGGLFAKDFDSQFDSHGLGQRRMKGTGAEIGTRDLARFGCGWTRFYRT